MTNAVLDTNMIVDRWRDLSVSDDDGNPAGPLYVSGPWARYDLTAPALEHSQISVCTASNTIQCC